jgi:hypothetical protein
VFSLGHGASMHLLPADFSGLPVTYHEGIEQEKEADKANQHVRARSSDVRTPTRPYAIHLEADQQQVRQKGCHAQ